MGSDFHQQPNFLKGRSAEVATAQILKQRGWHVIPSYDYSGEDGKKAPKLEGSSRSHIIPDLDVSKEGARLWIEVKTKSHAILRRVTQCLEHGIEYRHWKDYLEVQRITNTQVWLFIHEEDTGDILFQSLTELAQDARVYEGNRMGRGGMVFFKRSAFRHITPV